MQFKINFSVNFKLNKFQINLALIHNETKKRLTAIRTANKTSEEMIVRGTVEKNLYGNG